ncbi:thymidylate synthase [Brevibacterium phage LuckyBarnes]|uniref:Thymidylate synthase n=1 Tax=Brevibacterium phage LuckyBarnes TaxID=2027888 RepID=A0A249XNP8_9CAUD|nr:thymidylate synthase [Brevibacterium phage LuckyBarnes]ASZ73358.1 thymidylate synthase [Brevibacterium phage LuckyBarnes]
MNFTSATEALPHLLNKLLIDGADVPSRNGGTRELTMQHITVNQTTDPYITTPGRNVSLPAQIAETMWILAGRNDVEWLSNYLPQAPKFSDDGKTWLGGYGPRLRGWSITAEQHGVNGDKKYQVDQLQYIIDLLRQDPTTRRAVFAIYDPAADSAPGKDIPCNNWVHFLARGGYLHAHVAIRSNDVMWGWSGINSFEWSVLNQVVAAYAGLQPGTITYDISSLHLYEHHYDKAQRIVDQTLLADNELDAGMWNDQFPDESPWFSPQDAKLPLDDQLSLWFKLEKDIRENGGVKIGYLTNWMPPGLFRDWLLMLNAWWSQEIWPIEPQFNGTSMFHALVNSPKPKRVVGEDGPELPNRWSTPSDFCQSVDRLHRDKGSVYGKSWRKRGETFSILPNVGRKIDRLGVGGAGDSEADTYVDLAVYLAKYKQFLLYGLDEVDDMASPCDDFDMMQAEFERLDARQHVIDEGNLQRLTEQLKNDYEVLLVRDKKENRLELVRSMCSAAWGLAKFVAQKEGWEY